MPTGDLLCARHCHQVGDHAEGTDVNQMHKCMKIYKSNTRLQERIESNTREYKGGCSSLASVPWGSATWAKIRRARVNVGVEREKLGAVLAVGTACAFP